MGIITLASLEVGLVEEFDTDTHEIGRWHLD